MPEKYTAASQTAFDQIILGSVALAYVTRGVKLLPFLVFCQKCKKQIVRHLTLIQQREKSTLKKAARTLLPVTAFVMFPGLL